VRFLPRPANLAGPAIILLAAVIAAGPLFLRGPSCSNDFTFHFVSWIDAEHSMSAGLLYPHWASSPNFGAGEPKFVFYPPITWMAGAVLGMFLPWMSVAPVLFMLLLAATGLATRGLARMMLADGPATLAGCAAIFFGYALFSVYERNDFADLTGGFWIPLLLLFALRRQNHSGTFWERALDGSATPLALVVAGLWLSNGPEGIMASYLLAAIAIGSAVIEKSLVPVVRILVSTVGGMLLASLYLIPAVSERNWVNIPSVLVPLQYQIQNNWLFGLGGNPQSTTHNSLLHEVSRVAVLMLLITVGGGVVAWVRGVVPRERKWWLAMALIPPAILFLLLPVSRPVWNALPELQLLQFTWRWLVVLQAPMGIAFASAVWFNRQTPRLVVIAACTAVFVGIGLAAPHWWFSTCGTLPYSLQESVRDGIGFIGKPEYTPPGIRFPLVDFLLDSTGNVQTDPQGSPILQVVPDACLLEDQPQTTVQGETGTLPTWSGEASDCNSKGWQQLRLLSGNSLEQKWFQGIAEHAGYVILRLRYYPAWGITVNGVPVTAVAEQHRGLTAVPVPKGNVLIAADWMTTGDAVAGRCASVAALLLLTGLFLFERKRLRSHLNLDMPVPVDQPKQAKNIKGKKTHKSGRDGA